MKPGSPIFLLAFGALCIVWGTTWAVIQVGLAGIPPFTGVALRFWLAGLLLLVIALVLRVPLGRQPGEKLLWLANGMLAFTICYGVVYWAEQWVPSGMASVLFATYPLFVAIFSPLMLPGQSLGRMELIGAVIGFAGVAWMFGEDFSALGGRQVAIASLVMLASPLAAAFGSLMIKRWGSTIHPFSITAVPMLITGAVMSVVALFTERDHVLVFDGTSVFAVLYLAVMGSAFTFTLYYWLLSKTSVQRMALVAYITPVIAVSVGLMRGEPLTTRILAGSAIVIAGVALSVHRR